MNSQPPDQGYIGLLVACSVGESVKRFRFRHGCVLVGLGAALIALLICRDCWRGFPGWPVYLLTVAVVLDALLHAALNRSFEDEQLQAWKEVLALASTIEAKAGSGARKPPQQATAKKPQPKAGTALRVFQPDGDPEQVKL